MFAIIITLCASAAMNDCQVYSLGSAPTLKQCQAVAQIHRDVLGPANNYRLECEPTEESSNE